MAVDVEEIKRRMKQMISLTSCLFLDMGVVRATSALQEATIKKEAFLWCMGQDSVPAFHDKASEMAYAVALKDCDEKLRAWIFAMDHALARQIERERG